jgi:hypothetical protein
MWRAGGTVDAPLVSGYLKRHLLPAMTIHSKASFLTAVLAGGMLCSCAQYFQNRRISNRAADKRIAAERAEVRLFDSVLRSNGIKIPADEQADLDYRLGRDRALDSTPSWDLDRAKVGLPPDNPGSPAGPW